MTEIAVTNAYLPYKKQGGTRLQLGFRMNAIWSELRNQYRLKTIDPPVAFKQHKALDPSRLGRQHSQDVLLATANIA